MSKRFSLKNRNTLDLEELKEEKEDRRRFVFFLLIFLMLLFISTFGITVSFYKGGSVEPHEIETDPVPTPTVSPDATETPKATDNPRNPSPKPSSSSKPVVPVIPADDKIIFMYSDVDKGGNGINIMNAVPISDSKGKLLTGTGKYFDFSITATSQEHDLVYKVLINKNKESTLDNSDIRIYLTELLGNTEKELVLTTFDSLETQKVNNTNYYVLYQKRLEKGIKNYSDRYRLRMWVKDTAEDYINKDFMLKVDVSAVQVGD